MLQPVTKEIQAAVELLEQDWETPEQLAEELIRTIDRARSDRTMYIAVMQFGSGQPARPFYLAIGPYAGRRSAQRAAESFPAATEAHRIVVIPLTNQAGVEARLKEVG